MIKLKSLFDSLLFSQTSENSDLLPLLLVWEPWGLGRVPLLSFHDLDRGSSEWKGYKYKDGNMM